MMKKRYLLLCFLTVLLLHCKEKYILPDVGPSNGFLVVEGVINSGVGATTIKLSRSVKLVDNNGLDPERNAEVLVQGQDNSTQQLAETDPGIYSAGQLTINPAQQYRLIIKTRNGKEYQSDYASAIKTPAIDQITWERSDAGVELFVNTHSTTGEKYYHWDFDETWEFHSTYFSSVKYIFNQQNEPVDVTDRPNDEALKMFYCWKTEPSTSLLIGSTVQLSRDTVHLPIQFIPTASWKISVLYSINVKQYSLSADEYEFLRRMKKNTEQVGSLFDAQPSELTGNIHCLNTPGELVVGYIGVADVQEKRLFIDNKEVPGWDYSIPCEEIDIPNIPDTLKIYVGNVPTSVTQYKIPGPGISRFNVSTPVCADCTTRGSNVKPTFWP